MQHLALALALALATATQPTVLATKAQARGDTDQSGRISDISKAATPPYFNSNIGPFDHFRGQGGIMDTAHISNTRGTWPQCLSLGTRFSRFSLRCVCREIWGLCIHYPIDSWHLALAVKGLLTTSGVHPRINILIKMNFLIGAITGRSNGAR